MIGFDANKGFKIKTIEKKSLNFKNKIKEKIKKRSKWKNGNKRCVVVVGSCCNYCYVF